MPFSIDGIILRFPGGEAGVIRQHQKSSAADSPHKRPVAGCLGLPAQHRIRYRTPLASETEKADAGDRYGDIFVDTEKSHEAYKEWLAMTRPAPGPGGLRRPLWFERPLRPVAEAYNYRQDLVASDLAVSGTWEASCCGARRQR
jgi:hypothetical protein